MMCDMVYPISGINQRRAKVELVLSGNKVPAGVSARIIYIHTCMHACIHSHTHAHAQKEILMPQTVMGKLPQLSPEPHRFLPERWSRDKEDTPNMFVSLPFWFGPVSIKISKKISIKKLQRDIGMV